jgi:hypothetical protein
VLNFFSEQSTLLLNTIPLAEGNPFMRPLDVSHLTVTSRMLPSDFLIESISISAICPCAVPTTSHCSARAKFAKLVRAKARTILKMSVLLSIFFVATLEGRFANACEKSDSVMGEVVIERTDDSGRVIEATLIGEGVEHSLEDGVISIYLRRFGYGRELLGRISKKYQKTTYSYTILPDCVEKSYLDRVIQESDVTYRGPVGVADQRCLYEGSNLPERQVRIEFLGITETASTCKLPKVSVDQFVARLRRQISERQLQENYDIEDALINKVTLVCVECQTTNNRLPDNLNDGSTKQPETRVTFSLLDQKWQQVRAAILSDWSSYKTALKEERIEAARREQVARERREREAKERLTAERAEKADDLRDQLSDPMSKCQDLGFKQGTEKFGECVLRLSR